jgi:hypothetical protein
MNQELVRKTVANVVFVVVNVSIVVVVVVAVVVFKYLDGLCKQGQNEAQQQK